MIADQLTLRHASFLEKSLRGHIPTRRSLETLYRNYVPPLAHLLFFNPCVDERQLDADGFDNTHSPFRVGRSGDYELRWLRGRFCFERPLPLGAAVCSERAHIARSSNSRVGVLLTRTVSPAGSKFASVREEREYLYLLKGSKVLERTRTLQPSLAPTTPADFEHTVHLSETLVFRYSALTFNAHKIHYSSSHAISEGLSRPIVQGPLLATLSLRTVYERFPESHITSYTYRNSWPALVDDSVTVRALRGRTSGALEVYVIDSQNRVVQSGEVIFATSQPLAADDGL